MTTELSGASDTTAEQKNRGGRRPKEGDDTPAGILAVRMNRGDRAAEATILESERQRLRAVGVPESMVGKLTSVDVVRQMMRDAAARGCTAPAPPAAALALAPAPPAAALASPVEHPAADPDPLPPVRKRTDEQMARVVASVGGALACLSLGDELVKVATLVRGLAAHGLDRRDILDALTTLREAGAVELRPCSSPRLYSEGDQRLALPGPRGSSVLLVNVVGVLTLATPAPAPAPAPDPRQLELADTGKATKKPATRKATPALDDATDDELRAKVNGLIEGGMTRIEISALIGYANASPLSEWLRGVRPVLPPAPRANLVRELRRLGADGLPLHAKLCQTPGSYAQVTARCSARRPSDYVALSRAPAPPWRSSAPTWWT